MEKHTDVIQQLNINGPVTKQNVESAWREWLRKNHPDKNKTISQEEFTAWNGMKNDLLEELDQQEQGPQKASGEYTEWKGMNTLFFFI